MQDQLRRENIAFLEEEFPDIAKIVSGVGETVSVLKRDDSGEIIDIDLGGKGDLYKEDGRLSASAQVEHFFAHPNVIVLNQPSGVGLADDVSNHFNIFFGERFKEFGISEISHLPLLPSGLMVVFGIGLGFHLEEIVRRTRNHTVVLVEPFVEFFVHSLHTVDWRSVWSSLKEKGQNLSIVLEADPRLIQRELGKALSGKEAPSLDGTYLYQHYPSWIFENVIKKFRDTSYSYFIARGFFEDEIKMISQTTRNFLRKDFHLIEGVFRLVRPEPFFVVGSGPSLDSTIEDIRRWKDHAIIFSAGTALRTLLSNGIRPDFHCEIENVQTTADILQEMDKEFGLHGIKLIASCTVMPEVVDLFDEIFLFFRDSVSSTLIFTEDKKYRYVEGAAPTCTNTAFATATVLGFSHAYLFGLDCGVRDPERHHSISSVYCEERSLSKHRFSFPLKLPGNFGGEVYSHFIYDMTRNMIGALSYHLNIKMYNCSDGALIEGVKPKISRSLKFKEKIDKEKVFAEVRSGGKYFKAGEFFSVSERNYRDYLKAFEAASDEIDEWLDELCNTCQDVGAFCYEAARFVDDLKTRHFAVSELVGASMRNMPLVAQFYLLRLLDESKREEFLPLTLEKYASLVRKMLKKGKALWLELTEEVEAKLEG